MSVNDIKKNIFLICSVRGKEPNYIVLKKKIKTSIVVMCNSN